MTKYAVFSRGHNKDDIKHSEGTMKHTVDIHERYVIAMTHAKINCDRYNYDRYHKFLECRKIMKLRNFTKC